MMDSSLLAIVIVVSLSVLAVNTLPTGTNGYHYESYSCTCPDNIDPVCGSNGETYDSDCIFRCEQRRLSFKGTALTMRHTGSCIVEPNANIVAAEQLCICPFILQPVCGTDGNTYPNRCGFECEQGKLASQGRTISILHSGDCIQTVEPVCNCPVDGTSVCGTNGKTYPNECRLKCDQKDFSFLDVQYLGECRVDGSGDVPLISACDCSRNYDPMCASDGETYSNECVFNCKMTTRTTKEFIIHPGACVTTF